MSGSCNITKHTDHIDEIHLQCFTVQLKPVVTCPQFPYRFVSLFQLCLQLLLQLL